MKTFEYLAIRAALLLLAVACTYSLYLNLVALGMNP